MTETREIDALSVWIAGLAAAFAYTLVAAGGATWMDPGELAAASYHLGVAHPPGHPAHVMLGKLATLIPLGEVGFRVALLSAAAMGAAIAALVAIASRLVRGGAVAALLAALLVALHPAVLFNAARVEVYAPAIALVGWGLWAALVFAGRDGGGDARHALASVLGFGLAAAFHPLIAATAALPAAAWMAWVGRGRLRRLLPVAIGLGVLALAVYALLPVRAAAADAPALSWGDPSDPAALWNVLTGAAYRGNFALGETAGRGADSLALMVEGTGMPLVLAGIAGLALGVVTRLRGSGLLVAAFVLAIAAAATQSRLNPDLRAYLLPALGMAAIGTAILAAAIARIASGSSRQPRFAFFAQATAVGGLGLFGFCGAVDPDQPELGSPADLAAHFDATVGAMPPGPALYFANGDPSLFAAMYEQLVAGDRPDVGVASAELVRDRWFIEHLDRRLGELHVPFIDGPGAPNMAFALTATNAERGHPVGGDEPTFAPAPVTAYAPLDRGYRLRAAGPVERADEQAREPPDYRGSVGRKVAGAIGLTRASYEASRGRLRAAGVAAGFAEAWLERLDAVASPRRPALFQLLPPFDRAFIHSERHDRLLLADLLWRAGAGPAHPGGSTEQRVLAAWHRLLGGEWDEGQEMISHLGLVEDEATTRMLRVNGLEAGVERHLRSLLERRGEHPRSIDLLILLLNNRGRPADLEEAERLLSRAVELEPDNDKSHARLGVVRAKRGDIEGAAAAWTRALELNPRRSDLRKWLEDLESDKKSGQRPDPGR